jgi:hypothetical protein
MSCNAKQNFGFKTCGPVLLAWGYDAFQRCMHATKAHRAWMTERLLRIKDKHASHKN